MEGQQVHALVLLIVNDTATAGAMIDGVAVPSGAGSKEFARIPSAWIRAATEKQGEAVASSSSNKP